VERRVEVGLQNAELLHAATTRRRPIAAGLKNFAIPVKLQVHVACKRNNKPMPMEHLYVRAAALHGTTGDEDVADAAHVIADGAAYFWYVLADDGAVVWPCSLPFVTDAI
jgi:hypothetical protein